MADILHTTKNILIIAGDSSGDLHGANLIKALKEKDAEITVASMGGQRMQAVSDSFIFNLVNLGAAGFAEPFKRFFLWIRLIAAVRKFLEQKRPACVVVIDFYGFNHQVLGLAAHRKIPAIYYISPQVWASRPGRAKHIARLVKHIAVIFPFEEAIYRKEGADCTFVGHPLLDIMPQPLQKQSGTAQKIGILPGSRGYEVELLLPVFAKAFSIICETFPKIKPFIFAAKEMTDEKLLSLWEKFCAQQPQIIREDNYLQRAQMDFIITSSGTATLENALLGIP
ncbi:MAG: hypothetical protein NTW04_00630, partial [Elusimicrobia bacterium]|nr:hypothetical protein [Elusimicrobiota bacterium]